MPKTVLWAAVAIVWLFAVSSGCLGLFGNDFSTVSAHIQADRGASWIASIAPAGNQKSHGRNPWAAIPPVPLTSNRRRLRVVIYARYSTEEQDASSIEDQVAYCKMCLHEMGIEDAELTVLFDKETSGELRNRAGIDPIWEGVKTPEWDLLICEDASRLFRNETACHELIEQAVDNEMRVICINDNVDTNNEDWYDRLRNAAQHHRKANILTRFRIKRRHTALWQLGAAITKLRPGYSRKPTHPATTREPEKGPFFDSVDPQWAPIVQAAFERIANGEPPWNVGPWLKEQGLPGFVTCKSNVLLAKKTIALIRRPIYRGVDKHRVKVVRQKLRTGKKTQVWNEEKEVWTREMPHLQIVSDALWHRANQAIDARMDRKEFVRGADHPLFGIPRDSRGPLSKCFICGICGAKMHRDGRNEGGYRCSKARSHECWNKATIVAAFAHEQIGQAIGSQLLSWNGIVEPLMEFVQQLYQSDDQRRQREAQLKAEERKLQQQQSRLLRIASTVDNPPPSLIDELKKVDAQLAEARAWLQEFKESVQEQKPEVTRERIEQALRETSTKLLTMGREAGPILERLIPGKIRAVPYQQFGSTNVVLRAEFELQLVNLLPHDLRRALDGAAIENAEWAKPVKLTVDLFPYSEVPANALRAVQLYDNPDCTLDELAQTLGMSRRNAHRAKDLGKAIRKAKVTDPYIRLSEPPGHVAHWQIHPKFLEKNADGQNAA